MGGCCFQSNTEIRQQTFQKAYNVFNKIALKDKKIINRQAVDEYFTSYSQSCYDILMREMDFNNDGVITQNQWMAYWEYIRVTGYDLGKIAQELNRIEKGEVTLDFPKAKSFQPNQPRQTLLANIMTNMKNDRMTVPFLEGLQKKEV